MAIAGKPGHGTPASDLRTSVRTIASLIIALLCIRTFVVEPSHVPTGSMAPHRLGLHLSPECPACRFHFALGIGSDGAPARPICPNCGFRQFPAIENLPVQAGDRLWISKADIALRTPQRWEEVVFYAPGQPFTPHLKRIVGLPGERLRIVDGDLYADGVRLRKPADVRRRMSAIVFDMSYMADEGQRPGRWRYEVENPVPAYASTRWKLESNAAGLPALRLGRVAEKGESASQRLFDWADYRHFCPIRNDYGPVRDFLAYDGPDDGQGHVLSDLWFAARLKWEPDSDLNLEPTFQFRLTTPETDIRVTLRKVVESVPGANPVAYHGRVTIDGVTRVESRLSGRSTDLLFAGFPGGHDVEMSCVDHRFEFRIAGRLMFDAIDLDARPPRKPDERFRDSPVGFGVRGGSATVESFRLYRDIHYTNRLATEPVMGHGVRDDAELPADGFFVLGDDSAHSVDSRFFEAGPAVPKSAMIGRPIGRGRVP